MHEPMLRVVCTSLRQQPQKLVRDYVASNGFSPCGTLVREGELPTLLGVSRGSTSDTLGAKEVLDD